MVIVLYVIILVLFLLRAERANLVIRSKDGVSTVIVDMFEHESRNRTTAEMIQSVKLPDGVYNICTTDIPAEGCFGYSGPLAIPCYSFLRWKDARLPDFYDFYTWTPPDFSERLPRLLWVGNGTKNFEPRKNVFDKYASYKDFDIRQVSKDTYKTIYDHANYMYLLDIEGRGYSGRLKFLMLTGSVVFVMDRPHVEYWHNEFQPWVHYVPVKRDASNLIEQFEKVRAMQDEGRSIGERCRQRALDVFEKNRVYSSLQSTLASGRQSEVLV